MKCDGIKQRPRRHMISTAFTMKVSDFHSMDGHAARQAAG